jgi:hypothetical protein
MAASKYYQAILDTLQAKTDELRSIAPQRLDWTGSGALLDLYRRTSGDGRGEFIRAIGEVIQDHPAAPAVIAQLVNIASSLDLAELEPKVRKLQSEAFAAQEPLGDAIRNYLAFRELRAAPRAPVPSAANGRGKIGKATTVRGRRRQSPNAKPGAAK